MPHKRSRASFERRASTAEERIPVTDPPLPSAHPAPTAVLLTLESLRAALSSLNSSWLKFAARRLREILVEIDTLPDHAEAEF